MSAFHMESVWQDGLCHLLSKGGPHSLGERNKVGPGLRLQPGSPLRPGWLGSGPSSRKPSPSWTLAAHSLTKSSSWARPGQAGTDHWAGLKQLPDTAKSTPSSFLQPGAPAPTIPS